MKSIRVFRFAGLLTVFALWCWSDDIVTTNGTTYYNCRVKSRDSSGVKILHKAGVAYIPYALMIDGDKSKYGYNPNEERALFAEKLRLKEEADRAAIETARRKYAKEAEQLAEERVLQERQKKQMVAKIAKAEVEEADTESAQLEEEGDTADFAERKAIGFVKEWIVKGKLIDASCLGARLSLFPFGGEPNENFCTKRFLVDFEFKYLTSGGFERINKGSVQMGYVKQDKKWHSFNLYESTITGVPYLETGEGRAMIERAVATGFAQLNQMTATQKVTRVGATRGTGTRGAATRSGRKTEGGLSSTDKRWQDAKRIGR